MNYLSEAQASVAGLDSRQIRRWVNYIRKNNQNEARKIFYSKIIPDIINNRPVTPQKKYNGLISLLGFTPEAVVLTTKMLRPQKLVVLYTAETEHFLPEVRKYSGMPRERVVTVKFKHGKEYKSDIFRALTEALKCFNTVQNIILEITGGKKMMSVQLSIAAAILDIYREYSIDICQIAYTKYLSELRKPAPESLYLDIIENPIGRTFVNESKKKVLEGITKKEITKKSVGQTELSEKFLYIYSEKDLISTNMANAMKRTAEKNDLPMVFSDVLNCQGKPDLYINHINSSTKVVVDVSNLDPMVFYKLGIAQNQAKKVVLITRNKNKLPSYLSMDTIHTYFNNPSSMAKLVNDLRDALLRPMATVSDETVKGLSPAF